MSWFAQVPAVSTRTVPGFARFWWALSLVFLFCSQEAYRAGRPYKGSLEAIRKRRALRIATPVKNEEFLPRTGSPLDREKILAFKFARRLKVKVILLHPPSYDSLLSWVENGKADLAVAGLTATEARKKRVAFSRPVSEIKELLIGHVASRDSVSSLEDLAGKTIAVRPSSSYHETLQKIKERIPTLRILPVPEEMDTEEILYRVAKREYPFTLSDSHIAEAVLAYRKDLAILAEATDYRPIAWAAAPGCSLLLDEINAFLLEQSLTAQRDSAFKGDLKEIRERGVLRVITRNNAATYWLHRGEEVGFEFELCRAFAKHLGVRLEMIVAPSRRGVLEWLKQGRADLAAACLTITEERKKQVTFTIPYMQAAEVVVCRKLEDQSPSIKAPADLLEADIHIRKSSSYYQTLQEVEDTLPGLAKIRFVPEDMETEAILEKVAEGEYASTICDDYLAKMEMLFHDTLAIAFPIKEGRSIAWAMRQSCPKLKEAADSFFTNTPYKPRGLHYNILYRRYFEGSRNISQARSTARMDKHGKISQWDDLIKRYAKRYELDWRMLAAQIFQESRFDPEAKSWAGALGLMQIMPRTARELNVGDIRKPPNAIHGGAKYMRRMVDKFDKSIPYPSRYRFALASYNAGYGHVLDARRLASEHHLDPDQWFGHVEKTIVWLSRPEIAAKARYGYCRGKEPAQYVRNIQRLYNQYIQQVN